MGDGRQVFDSGPVGGELVEEAAMLEPYLVGAATGFVAECKACYVRRYGKWLGGHIGNVWIVRNDVFCREGGAIVRRGGDSDLDIGRRLLQTGLIA